MPDHNKYDAYERKTYIKELRQMWLHMRLFSELEEDQYVFIM